MADKLVWREGYSGDRERELARNKLTPTKLMYVYIRINHCT